MSASLLRKGLELLSSDSSVSAGDKKRQGKVTEALSSNKTGMKKQLKRLKKQGLPQTQRATVKDRVIKSAVEEYKKRASQDYLAQNLSYMLASHTAANEDIVNKVLKQHSGRKSKDQQKEKKKLQASSVFTESDFKRFEREYFGKK